MIALDNMDKSWVWLLLTDRYKRPLHLWAKRVSEFEEKEYNEIDALLSQSADFDDSNVMEFYSIESGISVEKLEDLEGFDSWFKIREKIQGLEIDKYFEQSILYVKNKRAREFLSMTPPKMSTSGLKFMDWKTILFGSKENIKAHPEQKYNCFDHISPLLSIACPITKIYQIRLSN
jgi:hypothetical protein